MQAALFAPLPLLSRGSTAQLDVDPSGTRVLYCSGKSVYLSPLAVSAVRINNAPWQDCRRSEEFRGHAHDTTVARFSPSGHYVASADAAGDVKIWDAAGAGHVVKWEYRVLSGRINDLCWSADSEHVVVVGEGRSQFAASISVETGASLGEFAGPTKPCSSVAVRPARPFRSAVASDDFSTSFYSGTPYRLLKTIRDHTRFVLATAYSPDGSRLATAGADGRIFVYDGLSGERIHELTEHFGHPLSCSVTSLAWSRDAAQLLSASTDGHLRLWDLPSASAPVSANTGQQIKALRWPAGLSSCTALLLDGTILVLALPELRVLQRIVVSSTLLAAYHARRATQSPSLPCACRTEN